MHHWCPVDFLKMSLVKGQGNCALASRPVCLLRLGLLVHNEGFYLRVLLTYKRVGKDHDRLTPTHNRWLKNRVQNARWQRPFPVCFTFNCTISVWSSGGRAHRTRLNKIQGWEVPTNVVEWMKDVREKIGCSWRLTKGLSALATGGHKLAEDHKGRSKMRGDKSERLKSKKYFMIHIWSSSFWLPT